MLKIRHRLGVLAIVVAIPTIYAHQIGRNGEGQEQLPPGERVLWVDPGDVASLDLLYGVGGSERQPQPPFRFVAEDLSGTSPKVNVTDASDVTWNVKWGRETRPSTFCTRLVWACGYVVPPEYFLARGRIDGVHGLKRAKGYVSKDGTFENARFQLRPDRPKYLTDYNWTWTNNPFVGTRELQGLKILMLLVSNWDTKDARDVRDTPKGKVLDSNLAIFEQDGFETRKYLYANVDWGASLGQWGNLVTWTRWDCQGFKEQTRGFVKGVDNGWLEWGFHGKHRKDVANNISVYDVQWLLQYLGRITDAQIQRGLEASGATQDEMDCYTRALRQRIEQLQEAATTVPLQTPVAGTDAIRP